MHELQVDLNREIYCWRVFAQACVSLLRCDEMEVELWTE
ncbi:protein of unknown function [Burkholderia multivorans]